MKIPFKSSVTIISVALLLFGFGYIPLFAQEKPGSGLQIAPTRYELVVERGTKKDIEIELTNVTSGDINAKVSVNDFEADNVTGQPKINPDPNVQSGPSIKRFVTNAQDLYIKKGEKKKVTITIDVPTSAVAGSYYGVVRYQALPVDASGEEVRGTDVALSASVGAIVLLEIPGDLAESMQIISVSAKHNDSELRPFFNKFPNKVAIEVKNTGNTFLKPFGKVVISKGNKEIYSYEMNGTIPPGNVLPNSKRIFTDDIKNVNSFGKYTITANIGYGKTGQLATLQTNFWVFPLWVLIAAIIFVLLLVFTTYTLYRKSKRAKRRRR